MEPEEKEFITFYAKVAAWIFLILTALTGLGIVIGTFINNQTT